MVYYVVAVHQEGQSEKAVEKRLSQIAQSHSSEVHGVNVDKSKFKIGTLDSLMELNDNLAKLDSQLDSILKRVERQAIDFIQQ